MGMRPYVVRQGDYLTQIAHRRGFSAEEVWNCPANKELRRRRANPDILQPGDVLYLPDGPEGCDPMPLEIGGENRFAATTPTVEVRLVLRRVDGTAFANKPFRVQGAGMPPLDGTTGGDGLALFCVPVQVREVDLSLDDGSLRCRVRVGHMDPADEPSGIAKRLSHLGYLARVDLGEAEPAARALGEALKAFQRAKGLPETGSVDDATRDALVQVHGS
ncbi:peptidoglycan-binding protein [Sorangium sp. So ce367]|uniref:peptidoglycan-binding domain-containing protein n=1 Tax=Sorangium sp. So ce367 TaxID=3133305 RepID=UPI003F645807